MTGGDWKGLVLSLCLLFGGALPALAVEPLEERTPTVWLGPETMSSEDAGIGRVIGDHRYRRLVGGWANLHDEGGELATVIVVRDPECPVSRRYGPRIAELARDYSRHGVGFVIIYLNDEVGTLALAEDARALDAPASYAGEGSFGIANALGVESTGDVFVLDARHRLRFRGAVDDQFGLGYTKDAPTRFYLRNALDALIEGGSVETPATTAPGCWIDADPAKDRGLQPMVQPGEVLS